MGKGRKGESLLVKEKTEQSWRSLKKDKLAAVIFGCKHHTITECLEKEIFGVPGPHYAYVKNVTAGLTLYLFNYTDRRLHGIFEAVSCGKMNIDPYAWITSGGTEHTPYPAQVRIRERRKCNPLREEQFKPIIANNYYSKNYFWFELDKDQNTRLIKLFLSSPSSEKLPRPQKLPHPPKTVNKNMFDILSSSSLDEIADEDSKSLDSEDFSEMAEMRLEENRHSSASAKNKDPFAPETKWADIFKPSMSLMKNEEVLESHSVRLSVPVSDCCDMEKKIVSSCEHKLLCEVCPDVTDRNSDSCVAECSETIAFAVDDVKEIYENKVPCLQHHDQDYGGIDIPCSENLSSLYGEGELMLSVMDYVLADEPGEVLIDTKEKVRSVLVSLGSCEIDHDQPNLTDKAFHKDQNSPSNFQNVVAKAYVKKLMQEVEGLKVANLNQNLKVKSLEHELVLCKQEIDELKKSCHNFDCKSASVPDNCNSEDRPISHFAAEKSVYIVGGFDGLSWVPDLSLFFPCYDHIFSCSSMSSARSYAAIAKLNGEIYIFGGNLDGICCDSVESYDPFSNQWVQRPSLKKRKGSLAGVSVSDKIFAIGGGNGCECFSEVESFDLNIGRWISTQSMLDKRFAPAATDINGAIYVTGGYDGSDYLRSAERFDSRERAWSRVGGMNEKRGCHSLVAFKEKLYAIGGYNGDKMVSSVEVFEPRTGKWTTGGAMRSPRGYFGSFVIGGNMYVVGGMRDEEVLGEMEVYKNDSTGWQLLGTTALGKRSFCNALVL